MGSLKAALGGGGFSNRQVFTTSQTFVIPDNVFEIGYLITGGGAGGSRPQVASSVLGGYGGTAACTLSGRLLVNPGDSFDLVIGAGGAGATIDGTVGGDGGDTQIKTSGGYLVQRTGNARGARLGSNAFGYEDTFTFGPTPPTGLFLGTRGMQGNDATSITIVDLYRLNFTQGASNVADLGSGVADQGVTSGSTPGGGGGGTSYFGIGGAGGDSVANGTVAGNGNNAPSTNYGAGGGGGGNTNGTTGDSGDGGNGSNGVAILFY